MRKYKVQIKRTAQKQIDKLPLSVARRVVSKIGDLSDKPRPPGSRKIVGSENTWRIRVGNYRMLYTIEDDILLVEVIRVRHRKDSYD